MNKDILSVLRLQIISRQCASPSHLYQWTYALMLNDVQQVVLSNTSRMMEALYSTKPDKAVRTLPLWIQSLLVRREVYLARKYFWTLQYRRHVGGDWRVALLPSK